MSHKFEDVLTIPAPVFANIGFNHGCKNINKIAEVIQIFISKNISKFYPNSIFFTWP